MYGLFGQVMEMYLNLKKNKKKKPFFMDLARRVGKQLPGTSVAS